MDKKSLKSFLDKKVKEYNRPAFIKNDPISIPHLFSKKEDIEIAGFFAAIFSWGTRTTIINKSKELLQLMDNAPHDFCLHHGTAGLKKLLQFKHRTFNTTDLLYFIQFFKWHYSRHNSLEDAFIIRESNIPPAGTEMMAIGLNNFYNYFFSLADIPERTKKHIASPRKNSSCKRLNMFLRWMVRKDDKGVDFGIWKKISPSQLVCPLDVHVSRVAKSLGILIRPASDWMAAIELTEFLRTLDREDPVKYDFALFGTGVMENNRQINKIK